MSISYASIRHAALDATESDLCVFPPREDGTKAPDRAWKQYQTQKSTVDDLRVWYGTEGPPKRTGMGIVCGAVSGNLEVLEFDAHGEVYEAFKTAAVALGLGELIERIEAGCLDRSPSGGIHWHYRSEKIEGSTKLAHAHKAFLEYTEADHEAVRAADARGETHWPIKVLIETRGEGGYIITAPTNGSVHPSHLPYERLRGSFKTIATISPEERETLWNLARSFDRIPEPEHHDRAERKASQDHSGGWDDVVSPIDDYNARTAWPDVLPAGWKMAYQQGDTEFWRRPGKDRGQSATINRNGSDRLFVFSSSTEFETAKPYTKFAVYARLKHGGDFKAASLELLKSGYGTFKAWVKEEGGWTLRTLQNPCPPGGKYRIAKPGEPPPVDFDGFGKGGAKSETDGAAVAPDEPEPWEPLRLGQLPPVEPFPDIILPDRVADFVRSVSNSIGCPPDFVGLSVLVVAGAAIGRSASLLLKPGYFANTSIYGMNIGGPSSGKSPAQEAAVKPMWEIDERFHALYLLLKQSYDEAMEAIANIPKGQPKPPPPTKPVLESAVLEDCTVEAVAPHLAINPRGLLVSRDEGSAWVASLGQYKNGRGSDRQFWLSALFGKPVRVDRKGNADLVPTRVPHPFLSFIGGMPPDMIAGLREPSGRSDGFVERILFAFPDARPRPHWSDAGIPDEVRASWAEIVQRLRDRQMVETDGKSHPEVYRFSPDAKEAWVAWYNAHADAVNDPGFNPNELAMEGKLCDFAARLALILQLLHEACDPIERDPAKPPCVSKWAVAGAIKLWAYFGSHHRRVRAVMEGRDLARAPEGARLILRWLQNHPNVPSFPESELTRGVPRLNKDRAMMEDGLVWLREKRVVRRLKETPRPAGVKGRKPAPVWEVHPSLGFQEFQENKEYQEKSRPDGEGTSDLRVNSPDSPDTPYSPEIREGGDGGTPDREELIL